MSAEWTWCSGKLAIFSPLSLVGSIWQGALFLPELEVVIALGPNPGPDEEMGSIFVVRQVADKGAPFHRSAKSKPLTSRFIMPIQPGGGYFIRDLG